MQKLTFTVESDIEGVEKNEISYVKYFPKDVIDTGDYFEACLEFYTQQGYMNDVSIDIDSSLYNSNVTYSKENYINREDVYVKDIEEDIWSGE